MNNLTKAAREWLEAHNAWEKVEQNLGNHQASCRRLTEEASRLRNIAAGKEAALKICIKRDAAVEK